jgi:hypothetical protein
VAERAARLLFLSSLFLLPWGALLPLRALHEHASWGDAVFALATTCWAASLVLERRLPRLRLVHAGLALYLGWAGVSFLVASPRAGSGPAKLLGMAMLAALFVVTSEMMRRPGMSAAIGRTLAATAFLSALAAIAGVLLALFGRTTPLVGPCGDLLPGPVSRAQAGFPHPNLLASFCVFASAVVAREDAGLTRWMRRLVQAALTAAVLLTTSRAILAFALSAAIRHAATPGRRRFAKALAAVLVVAMAALTLVNLVMNPARPWEARVLDSPSPRLEAAATSLDTLARHPWFGSGPGSLPGLRGRLPFDAHFTPLNVAATLGLPALGALVLLAVALWRARTRPTDRTTWGLVAALALDGLGQDVEDFRHLWIALGLADAGRRED